MDSREGGREEIRRGSNIVKIGDETYDKKKTKERRK
jgi:hypothetical protein